MDGKKATERMVGGGGEERKEILQLRIVERGLIVRDKDGGEPWTARREWERARKVPRGIWCCMQVGVAEWVFGGGEWIGL